MNAYYSFNVNHVLDLLRNFKKGLDYHIIQYILSIYKCIYSNIHCKVPSNGIDR